MIVLAVWWHYFLHHIPMWIRSLSHPIFQATQRHSGFGRVVHVVLNAVPDIAFALLAIAGLGYLMPETVRNLENKRATRVFLIMFFAGFGLFAIIVNAVNREDQEHKEGIQETRMGVVTESVIEIQSALQPKATSMTEPERREHLLASLRDEYILKNDVEDPDILTGHKMPPQEWMNARLKQLGETWQFSEPKNTPPAATQIVQEIAPEPKMSQIEISFYNEDMVDNPAHEIEVPLSIADRQTFTVSVAMFAKDVPAKNVHMWLRGCDGCTWVAEPTGSSSVPEHPFDREFSQAEMLPNVAIPKITISMKRPILPPSNKVMIGFYFACDNCPVVDQHKPIPLWVTFSPMLPGPLLPNMPTRGRIPHQ